MLHIELNQPRFLGFRGQTMVFKPGVINQIPEKLFLDMWKIDRTLRFYYESKAFSVLKDGVHWNPPGADVGSIKPTDVVTGIKIPAGDMVKPELAPPPPEPAPSTPIEPTPMSGGSVPGNANAAQKHVELSTDVGQLKEWFANETRTTIKRLINKRLAALEE